MEGPAVGGGVERVVFELPRCAVRDSFRVQQVRAMFDVGAFEGAERLLAVERPVGDWTLGVICGPSGSGKSTAARFMFPGSIGPRKEWPRDVAVIEGLGEMPLSEGTGAFLSVGFGSAPSWLRPYCALSDGEKFRCDMAAGLLRAERDSGLLVVDEFTSALDRRTAKYACLALAKRLRRGGMGEESGSQGLGTGRGCRLVVVTGHEDVVEWLQPDWVLSMPWGRLTWRCIRRVGLRLELQRCSRKAWDVFKGWHYLAGSSGGKNSGGGLSPTARCHGVWADGCMASFIAVIPLLGKRNHWRVTRLVTLPGFQGVGIGGWALDAMGELYAEQGLRMSITTGHAGVGRHCGRSSVWRLTGYSKLGRVGVRIFDVKARGSFGRSTASFAYVGARDGGKEAGGGAIGRSAGRVSTARSVGDHWRGRNEADRGEVCEAASSGD